MDEVIYYLLWEERHRTHVWCTRRGPFLRIKPQEMLWV